MDLILFETRATNQAGLDKFKDRKELGKHMSNKEIIINKMNLRALSMITALSGEGPSVAEIKQDKRE